MRYDHHKMKIQFLQISQNMENLNNPTMDETEVEDMDNPGNACQLTMERRANIVSLLLWGAVGFTIPRGAIGSIAEEALCSEKAVQKILTRLKGAIVQVFLLD